MVSNEPWAFEPALAFLESESVLVVPPDIPPVDDPPGKTASGNVSDSDGTDGGVTLGSFGRVYRALGVPTESPPDWPPHDDGNESADSTLVTSPPLLVLDASDGDVDNEASSGTESSSGLAAAAVEAPDSTAVAVGKHHKTNKKKKEKKKKRALAAQEKAVEAQNAFEQELASYEEKKQQPDLNLFEPILYSQAASKHVEEVARSGETGKEPTVTTGQAVPVLDRPFVTNPLELLSKGRSKEKKSLATVAVAPPVADKITPALSSYVQRSDCPATAPVTQETKKPVAPGPIGRERQEPAQQGLPKQRKEQLLPSVPTSGRLGHPDPFAEQLPIPLTGMPPQHPSHMLSQAQQLTHGNVVPHQYGATIKNQLSQLQHQLPSSSGITYPGSMEQAYPVPPVTAPFKQQPGVPYYILPNVHIPNSAHLPPTFHPTDMQPVASAPKKAAPTNTQKPRAPPPFRVDRHLKFLTKLANDFPADAEYLVAPMRLKTHDDPKHPHGIHVFIDASNILIGFRDFMRERGAKNPELCIGSLFLLLERKRPVAKRVYVGSRRSDAPMLSYERHMELACAVGYETNIYERVWKAKEKTEKQLFHDDAQRFGYTEANRLQAVRRDALNNASATTAIPYPANAGYAVNSAGPNRASGAGNPETGPQAATSSPPTNQPTLKWAEQGVDELIQLKMMHSIVDYIGAPSTMVLATGDGAAAEFSDGFFKHVVRALKRGWTVELVTWRKQMNGEYKRREFREKWGEQFRVVELDGWWEGLVESAG